MGRLVVQLSNANRHDHHHRNQNRSHPFTQIRFSASGVTLCPVTIQPAMEKKAMPGCQIDLAN
jgi:hypothetical protein